MTGSIMRRFLDAPYEYILGIVIIIIAFCVMSTAVVLRYGFGTSIFWSEELCRIALVILAFLGIPIGFRNNSHMYVDILRLYGGVASKISTIAYIASSAVFLIILLYSIYAIGTQLTATRTAALRMSLSWVYLLIGAATAFGLVRLVQFAIKEAGSAR